MRNNGIVAALLVLFFGPLGFLYIGWKHAVLMVLMFLSVVLILTFIDQPIPEWSWLVVLPFIAYKAYVIADYRNLPKDDLYNYHAMHSSFDFAYLECLDTMVGMVFILGAVTAAYMGIMHLIDGSILKGLASLTIGVGLFGGIPALLVTFLGQFLAGIIGFDIEKYATNLGQ